MPNAATLFADALAAHQAGRLFEAERAYRQILAVRPDHFDSMHLLGVVFLQRGAYPEAVAQIDRALVKNPRNIVALNNRGIALSELQRCEEALASFERALILRSDYADAHANRGITLKKLARLEEALESYDRALAIRPDAAETHSNRADVLNAMKRYAEALASCARALALRPNLAVAHCNRGNALHGLSRFDEAIASFDRALALRPDYGEAYSNRGNALHELNRFVEALASYDRALALRPDYGEAHSNRGNALQELHRFEEALASYDRALALRPNLAPALSNRGNALRELDRFDAALESFGRALELQPDFADAHFNAAVCRLLLGDMSGGWPEWEWRWEIEQLSGEKRTLPQPLWTGSDDIAGKTILLHAEQGFGDTLQFCRYAPLVTARGARVVLEVQKPLLSLMRTLRGPTQVIARGDPLPDIDLHCPLLSLPLALGTRLDTIPAKVPYLTVPDDKRSDWRSRFADRRGPRVGLAWAGSPRPGMPNANRIDRQRSIAFDQLAPLFDASTCQFYSLQKGEQAVAQLRASALSGRIIDWSDELHDFADTAALIENLDLVISVDTAVVHLAGTLNKPFWLINRYNTCWRWLLERDDSPWYPTARLFRQDRTRTWDDVIARIAAALRDYARGF